ncbi:SUKH-4 family immunity protein [Streptomyces cavernae]|uniref:SUKH-4 family immunity protein n=1 Tax=Streptomyces cavernae TaxID=2259034 RepID=UPI0030B804C8
MSITEAGAVTGVTDEQWALIVGPAAERGRRGSGPAQALSHRFLVQEFGPGAVMRFEDVDFPAELVHEPTRCFLRETGLPEDGFLFQFDTDVPLPTLAEYYAEERPGEFTEAQLPAGTGRLIRLGRLAGGPTPVLDGTTGAVHGWHEQDLTLSPLSTDISTFVVTLWLLHRGWGTTPRPGGLAGSGPSFA